MQNGTTNGTPRQNERVTPEIESAPSDIFSNGPPFDSATLDQSGIKEELATDRSDGPPSKRRKVASSTPSRRSSSRAISPPWKKAGVDGPTSKLVDGKRRSTRVSVGGLFEQPASTTKPLRSGQKQYKGKSLSNRGDAVAGRTTPLGPILRDRKLNTDRPRQHDRNHNDAKYFQGHSGKKYTAVCWRPIKTSR